MNTVVQKQKHAGINPKKFILWLFLGSIVMLFAALTSAYIVKKAGGGWLEFDLPELFLVNTVVIVLSSVTLHWAYLSAKRNRIGTLKATLIITFTLGLYFIGGQYLAWEALADKNIALAVNSSGDFLYILTGLHVAHLIAGIIFILIVLNSTFRKKVNANRLASLQMCTTFWHFLTGLWVYLYVFLLINH